MLVEQPLMRNVLADLCVESEAATISAMRLARAYDEAIAGDEEAAEPEADRQRRCSSTGSASGRRCTPASALECLGGNGYVEESGMPRLFRESPLNSIWEGSGNVQCLDVLRAMVKSPASLDAFFAEVEEGAVAEPRLDAYAAALRDELPGDIETIEARARRVVERMALALQGSLLVRYGDEAVADAFCASRLGGDWGQAFGTLPAGTDFARIIERHRPAPERGSPSVASGPKDCRLTTSTGVAQRSAHLLGRDHSAEAAVGVDRHQGAEAAQVLVAEQRVERGVVAD